MWNIKVLSDVQPDMAHAQVQFIIWCCSYQGLSMHVQMSSFIHAHFLKSLFLVCLFSTEYNLIWHLLWEKNPLQPVIVQSQYQVAKIIEAVVWWAKNIFVWLRSQIQTLTLLFKGSQGWNNLCQSLWRVADSQRKQYQAGSLARYYV